MIITVRVKEVTNITSTHPIADGKVVIGDHEEEELEDEFCVARATNFIRQLPGGSSAFVSTSLSVSPQNGSSSSSHLSTHTHKTSYSRRPATMNTLLRWSIENSGTGETAPQQQPGQPGWTNSSQPRLEPKKFDTGIIDAILGKPDSVLMKEALEVATNNDADEDDRLQALDNFEMVSQAVVCISSCR